MSLTEEQAQQLLDFEQESIDVSVLDTIVKFFYEGRPGCQEQKMAEEIMKAFQDNENAWRRVSQILQESSNSLTKHFALNILKTAVNTRWKMFPEEERDGIKNFVVTMTINLSESFDTLNTERVLLTKLNAVLVSIVIKTWPHEWSTFVPDIVGASKTSEPLCQNNMEILKLLSEEIFSFSRDTMVQVKIQHLKDAMCEEYASVHELILLVLENSEEVTLINQTLETLLRFLRWIPVGYVFKSNLISTLVTRLLNVDVFRSATLECLSEIAALPGDDLADLPNDSVIEIQEQQVQLLQSVLEQLEEMLPSDTDIASVWEESSMEDQGFVRTLSLFFTSWLKQHGHLLEDSLDLHPVLFVALNYMVLMSNVDDTELFKICLEYWQQLASTVYSGGGRPGQGQRSDVLKKCYTDVLSNARQIVISHMAKPEEVLVVEKDGETVREFVKDTDTIELYKSMRTTLVFLTHIDTRDTLAIMEARLKEVSGVQYSWHNLNTLCWAVGSISGALSVDDERTFLVHVIRDLLSLCEAKKGKHHKAIIASNIMYVVGQYPRFLKMHWRFLKTVVNKLFEFMHEEHEGVQDMACDTFLKIAQKCCVEFVKRQAGSPPFVETIISNMGTIVNDLTNQQVQTFFQAMGEIVAAEDDTKAKGSLIWALLDEPNKAWGDVVTAIESGNISDESMLYSCVHLLRCETAVCEPVGEHFSVFLEPIYLSLLNVYSEVSRTISEAIASEGEGVVNQPVIRYMRIVRTEILKLITMWMSKTRNHASVVDDYVPPLLEAILVDYQEGHPQARNHEVLGSLATLVARFKQRMQPLVPGIFETTFEPTLSMIKEDFSTFPDHRKPFYQLLNAIASHCFDALDSLDMDQWRMLIDAIVWGFQHPLPAVSDLALRTLRELLNRIFETGGDFFLQFCQNLFLHILEALFAVVTDSAYVSGMNYHSQLLAKLFDAADKGTLDVQLSPDQTTDSRTFVAMYVAKLLKDAFPHFQDDQVEVLIEGFFAYTEDVVRFKQHLRDFLVQCKEYNGEDLSDLYLEERAQQVKQAQEDKMKTLRHIPGMLNPYNSLNTSRH